MDRVRFGRALGYGARHAAKTLHAAVAAAAAPTKASGTAPSLSNPAAAPLPQNAARARTSSHPSEPAKSEAGRAPTAPLQQVLRGAAQIRAAQREAGKHARRSFLSPVAKFSSVVSLQVTGTFFALIALIMGQAFWRSRAALRLGAANGDARRLYVVGGVALLFAYFAISNFVRAARRDRQN